MKYAGAETRASILKTLIALPCASDVVLSDEAGKSRTAVRYQLDKLKAEGYIRDDMCACCGAEIRVVVMAWPE